MGYWETVCSGHFPVMLSRIGNKAYKVFITQSMYTATLPYTLVGNIDGNDYWIK